MVNIVKKIIDEKYEIIRFFVATYINHPNCSSVIPVNWIIFIYYSYAKFYDFKTFVSLQAKSIVCHHFRFPISLYEKPLLRINWGEKLRFTKLKEKEIHQKIILLCVHVTTFKANITYTYLFLWSIETHTHCT